MTAAPAHPSVAVFPPEGGPGEDPGAETTRTNQVLAQAINAAEAAWRQGDVAAAEALCSRILAHQPAHAGAVLLSGMLAFDQGRHAEGLNQLRQSLALQPTNPAAWVNLAKALGSLGDHGAAANAYGEAVRLRPDLVDLRIELVTNLVRNGNLDEAVTACHHALEAHPEVYELHRLMASILMDQGKAEEARIWCERGVRVAPGQADAFVNLGITRGASGDIDGGIDAYKRAIALNPEMVIAHGNLGFLLMKKADYDAAETVLRQAVDIDPNFANGHYNLGILTQRKEDWGAARAFYQKALTLNPNHADAEVNLGIMEEKLGCLDAAIHHYEQGISLNPNVGFYYSNLGNAWGAKGDVQQAKHFYRTSIEKDPALARAHVHLGQALLMEGAFEEGWAEYEYRLDMPGADKPNYDMPVWTGQDLTGRKVLLWGEQGAGDALQFIRYAQMVKDQGATTIVQSPPALASLLRTTPGVDQVVVPGDDVIGIDYHCALMSLPHRFGTGLNSIPGDVPYLSVPDGEAPSLPQAEGKRIGLVWAGNPQHKNDHNRSARLEALRPLFQIPGTTFVSLQVGDRAKDIETLGLSNQLFDGGALVKDYADTAALLSQLDLLITVDTSVAHVAGALGTPTWLMVPFVPDFRWLLDRDDSPWYPTLRLFRQTAIGDWDGVVDRITQALTDRLSQT